MATKKPTAKQLAARALFAQRSRAGTLGKKRKANPAKNRGAKRARVAWMGGDRPPEDFPRTANEQSLYRALLAEQVRDWKNAWGDKPDADTMETFKRRALMDAWATVRDAARRKTNPAKKTSIARTGVSKAEYTARPSQATRRKPSPRLVARRKGAVGAKAKPGYFPNPNKIGRDRTWYCVDKRPVGHDGGGTGGGWSRLGYFEKKTDAVTYANAYVNANKQWQCRVYRGRADRMPGH